jgi:hypothetical protein
MPSGGAKLNLCILWEEELRTASRLLMELQDDDTDDVWSEKARNALQACMTALWGLTDDKMAVMVGAGELHRRMVKDVTTDIQEQSR